MRPYVAILVLALAALACQTLAPRTPTPEPTALPPTHTPAPTATPTAIPPTTTPTRMPTSTPVPNLIPGVRACDYIPGVSHPADLAYLALTPTPTPYPFPPLPTNTAVKKNLTAKQLGVYRELWMSVNKNYVYPDFNGHDWVAIGEKYKALITAGLTEEDFYYAMSLMIYELGDDHSSFFSPADMSAEEARFAGEANYVGVGIMVDLIPDTDRAVILYPFPGGPADEAGLRAHDIIVAVDGEPTVDETGSTANIRGPAGSSVVLTIQRPGDSETFEVTLKRRRIEADLPVDFCVVPGTRIAYILIPGLDDRTVGEQMLHALEDLTAYGPLEGVVLDNRLNYGGALPIAQAVLGLFTEGTVGHFVGGAHSEPVEISGEDISGSQTVPLVVLVDVGTASFGEIMSGVLRNEGRARIVGQTTLGNVEVLLAECFSDDSCAWIAQKTFRPARLPNAIWEKTGIIPDVIIPSRWDLFTEATDPVLAKAVELLLKGK